MSLIIAKNREAIFDVVQPDIEKWAIYQLSQDRDNFSRYLVAQSIEHILKLLDNNPKRLHEEIAKALYLEHLRMKAEPWKVDPPDEKAFWGRVNDTLVEASLKKPNEQDLNEQIELFRTIVVRYAHEIIGTFSPPHYRFATKVVSTGIARLLNAVSSSRFFSNQLHLNDRLKITGPIETIRQLSTQGTLLLTPTHFSNLDSMLVGWAIASIGLPAFLYGAGLNLFNGKFFGYFMNRLGAYKVDRRKKNTIYIETLKKYSQLTLQRGCHSLFFPGGTRSRSGQIETQLKLGLLSSAIEAQRMNFVEAKENNTQANKIFVVPLAINYHFVLEASSLIDEHLKRSGKERYFIDRDEFPGTLKMFQFMRKFFSIQSEVILSFGEPIDIFGNTVDAQGNSYDKHGKKVDVSAYFLSDGSFKPDYQRDSEYTKMLANCIIKGNLKANTVLSSHLVAFAAFEILARKNRRMDLYGLLRLPEDECIIPYKHLVSTIELLQKELIYRTQHQQLHIADNINASADEIITHALANLGIYHAVTPLKLDAENNQLIAQNMNLLYFYHNRLMGYELEQLI